MIVRLYCRIKSSQMVHYKIQAVFYAATNDSGWSVMLVGSVMFLYKNFSSSGDDRTFTNLWWGLLLAVLISIRLKILDAKKDYMAYLRAYFKEKREQGPFLVLKMKKAARAA